VSRICEAVEGEFDARKTRDLSEVELDDLVADGSYFTMRPGAPAEPVLVARARTNRPSGSGSSVRVGLQPTEVVVERVTTRSCRAVAMSS
jgi:hypothetical protein